MSSTVSTVTLDYLVQQCLKRAKVDRSNFVSIDDVREMLRASIRALYDKLVAAFEDYHRTLIDETVAILDPESRFTLPADFYKLRGVDYQLGQNQWVTLDETPWNERNRYSLQGGAPYGYYLFGQDAFGAQESVLQVIPEGLVPVTAYRIFYTPKPNIPVNGADKVDGINGWEEYCIYDVTAQILEMASRDHGTWDRKMAEINARITVMSKRRNTGKAKQSAITQNQWAWPWTARR